MFMIGLGMMFLVLGAGLLLAGLAIPGGFEELLGLTLTGGIFVFVGAILMVIGLVMRRRQAREARIRRDGMQGTAVIMDIGETSMTVNDRPVLDLTLQVTVPSRSPYTARKRITMPWNALGRLAVGASVPVMVDRVDPDAIVIDWAAAPAVGQAVGAGAPMALPGSNLAAGSYVPGQLGAPGLPMASAGGPQAPAAGGDALLQYLRGMGIEITGPVATMIAGAVQAHGTHGMPGSVAPGYRSPGFGAQAPVAPTTFPRQLPPATMVPPTPQTVDIRPDEVELRRSGLAGRATIRGAEDLGVGADGKRLVRLDLEVTPAGRTAYPVQQVTMAPQASMPRLAPGVSLAVHVDPANPQNLAIDWDGA